MNRVLLALAVTLLCFGLASAEGDGSETNPYRLPELDAQVTVDGVLDEPEWGEALALELAYETNPGENLPAPVRTDLYLFSTATHLYAAFVAEDPDPSRISSSICERDRMYDGDRISLILDTFNDQRRSYMLFTNAHGIQGDALDKRGMGAGDTTWDGIWESSGRITDNGYVIEMAIPFSTLRFQRGQGEQVWGIGAGRRRPRDMDYRTALSMRDRNNTCYLCQVAKVVGFANATPGRNLEIDPTVTGVMTKVRASFPSGDFVDPDPDDPNPRYEAGVTARWGFTPNLVLSGTVNPDFSQVEADAFQLDVNERFALYYEEKRPFFYEGMEFFETNLNAVYTRSIADPSWGAKLTGKEGGNAVGVVVAQDEVTNLIFPGPQGSSSGQLEQEALATVLRYRRDVGSSSTLGALYTDRRGDEYANQVGGIDGTWQLLDSDMLDFQTLWTRTDYPDDIAGSAGQAPESFDGAAYDLEYNHSSSNYDWWLAYRDVDDGYRSDLGFRSQNDYRQGRTGITRNWRGEPGQWFSDLSAGGGYVRSTRRDDGFPNGELLSSFVDLWLNYGGPARSYVNFYAMLGRESYLGTEYEHRRVWNTAGYWPTPYLNLELETSVGDQVDYDGNRPGTIWSVQPELLLKVGRVDLYAAHEFERLDAEDERVYSANVSYVRGVYQFTRRASLRAVVQYLDVTYGEEAAARQGGPRSRMLASQILFSYKINPQTVVYLGYSDDHFGDEVTDLTQNDRTFFAKIGYAFVM